MVPKILVISCNPFSKSSNNGKTLEAILRGFPQNKKAQLFFSLNELPDLDYCDNYFRICDIDVISNIFLKQKKYTTKFNPLVDRSTIRKKTFVSLIKKAIKTPLLRDFLWSLDSWKISDLSIWLQNFNPDIIFYMGGGSTFIDRVTLYVTKLINKPLVVYYTDDYLLYPIANTIEKYIQKKRINKSYKQLINKASLHFAIGDLMAKEYSLYFMKNFLPIMNLIDFDLHKPKYDQQKKNKLVVSYFGGLHLKRDLSLLRLGKIFSQLDVPIDFQVYTGSTLSKKLMKEMLDCNINFHGFVDSDNLKKKIDKSDILLHVESDDKYSRRLTRLSVSTKIPEYLSANRCLLAFGPSELASNQLIIKNKIGFFISSSMNDTEIIIQLNLLFKDSKLREQIAERSYCYALKNFDAKVIRNRFNNEICKLVDLK